MESAGREREPGTGADGEDKTSFVETGKHSEQQGKASIRVASPDYYNFFCNFRKRLLTEFGENANIAYRFIKK